MLAATLAACNDAAGNTVPSHSTTSHNRAVVMAVR